MSPRPLLKAARQRQHGALLIMFAMVMAVTVGFMGLALDVAQVYNRKTELQNLADAAALAAARSLVGSAAGIADAVARARSIAQSHRYQYRQGVTWSDEALTFGTSPDGPWSNLAAAQAAPQAIYYAKVDTSNLDAEYGQVKTVFMNVFDPATPRVATAGRAVAGRSAIEVAPLAICAMDVQAAAARVSPGPVSVSELVQHGFRRGVGYNLLNLNPQPNAVTPEYFLVHALTGLALAGAAGSATDAALAPFMCSGTVQLPRLVGRPVTVRRPGAFSFSEQLNSRFNVYGAGADACRPNGARPDRNIAEYLGAAANWMTPLTARANAEPALPAAGQPLYTVADRAPDVAAPSPGAYGPLWAFGPALSSAAPNLAIARAEWSKLYPAVPGAPAANGSYVAPPYSRTSGAQFLAPGVPGAPGQALRRLLNIPLLQCPVPAGTDAQATVLAIGRFLMTSKAGAELSAEFAGLVNEATIAATVELYQ